MAQMLDVVHQRLLGGQELVDRWIKQPDGDRTRGHNAQDFLEIAALHRQQLSQRGFAVFGGLGQNHFQYDGQTFLGVEHALGTAQANAHRAVVGGALRGVWGIRIRHHLEGGDFVGPTKQGAQFRGKFRLDRRHFTQVDPAAAAINGDDIAFVQHHITDHRLALMDVDVNIFGTDHAGLAHTARDHRRVRGLAAPASQNADRREETVNVFRLGLFAHQDDFFVGATTALHGGIGVEHDLARGCTRRRAHPLGRRSHLMFRVELREHHLFQRFGINTQQGFFAVDQAFVGHFHRAAHHRRSVHLAVTGLQAVEHALFDGVLVILHFVVVAFQLVAQFDQLPEQIRHLVFHLQHGLGGADAGHHVLALSVDQVLAVHHVFASAGVAGEADAGRAIVTHVAEHHGHDIDGGAVGLIWSDLEFAAVIDGALAHPRAEHGLNGQLKLLIGVLRERPPGLLLNDFEEQLADVFQVVGAQAQINLDACTALDRLKVLIEMMIVHPQRDLAKQLDETTISVITEAFVAGELDQPGQGGLIQAQIEDGVHHARHGHRRAGAYRDQQRIARTAKLLAGFFFQPGHMCPHIVHHAIGQAIIGNVVQAGFRTDDEARRHPQPDLRHFAEVGPFTAQQHFILAVAFGVLVNVFFCHDPTFCMMI